MASSARVRGFPVTAATPDLVGAVEGVETVCAAVWTGAFFPDRLETPLDDGVSVIEAYLDRGAEYTLETTGHPSVLRQATGCLASGGTCGIIGVPPMGEDVSLDVNHILNGGRPIRGIVEGDSIPMAVLNH